MENVTREEFISEDAYREFVKDLMYYGRRITSIQFMADKDIWVVTHKSLVNRIGVTHIYHLDRS